MKTRMNTLYRLIAGICVVALMATQACGPEPKVPDVDCKEVTPGDPLLVKDLQNAADANTLSTSTVEIQVKVLAPPTGTKRGTQDEIDSLVVKLRETPLVPRQNGTLAKIKFDQFRNDCEDRAHLGVSYILKAQPELLVGKAFIAGKLSVFGGALGWGYHVAPYALRATDAGPGDVLVLDPALNGQSAIPLKNWAHAVTASSPKGTTVQIYLTRPESWNANRTASGFIPEGGPSGNDQRSFCDDVGQARDNLSRFIRRTPSIVTRLRNVTVETVDATTGLVTFKGRTKTYGPFAARIDLIQQLEAVQKSGQHVNVKRQRLYTDNTFKNFWRYLFGGLEAVQTIEVIAPEAEDETEQSEPLVDPEIEREK